MNIFDALGPVAYAVVLTVVMAVALVAMRISSPRRTSNLSEVIVEPNDNSQSKDRERV